MSRTPARITQADVARETFIYFMRAGEFVKIGRSSLWKSRLRSMQTGSPYTIVPLLVMVGDHSLEKKLHNRFRESRFRGEWFHFSPAIRSYIKDNLHNCVAKSGCDDLRARNSWEDPPDDGVRRFVL